MGGQRSSVCREREAVGGDAPENGGTGGGQIQVGKEKEDGSEVVEVENRATKNLKPLSTPLKPLLSFRNLQTVHTVMQKGSYISKGLYLCIFSPCPMYDPGQALNLCLFF